MLRTFSCNLQMMGHLEDVVTLQASWHAARCLKGFTTLSIHDRVINFLGGGRGVGGKVGFEPVLTLVEARDAPSDTASDGRHRRPAADTDMPVSNCRPCFAKLALGSFFLPKPWMRRPTVRYRSPAADTEAPRPTQVPPSDTARRRPTQKPHVRHRRASFDTQTL